MGGRTRPRTSERGQTSLLILGFFLVALLLAAVVVDASAAYLRHQQLASLADGAALAAADGVQGEQVYTTGLGERAVVDPRVAREYVADYLAATGAARRHPGLRVSVVGSGDRITVRLAAPLRLPIPPPGFADRAVVAAESSSAVLIR